MGVCQVVPSSEYSKRATPGEGVPTVIVPELPPLQSTSVLESEAVILGPTGTDTLMILVAQPPASVATTVCEPEGTFRKVYGADPLTGVPPSSVNVNGAVPPDGEIMIVPLAAPLQVVPVVLVMAESAGPEVMLILSVRVQPLLSRMLTMWLPDARLLNVLGLGPGLNPVPSISKLYGAVPDVAVTVIVPFVEAGQVVDVLVKVAFTPEPALMNTLNRFD